MNTTQHQIFSATVIAAILLTALSFLISMELPVVYFEAGSGRCVKVYAPNDKYFSCQTLKGNRYETVWVAPVEHTQLMKVMNKHVR